MCIVLPISLFDQYHMMRKSDKVGLGRYLKNINQSTLKSCSFNIPLIIRGGWLIHQLSSFKGCDNYGEVTKEYLKLIPKMFSIREITCHLDHKEKKILLLIHSISSCDSVSGLFGFTKVKVLKKAITFDEQGQLAKLLSVKESK